ncbi:hypothetical protein DFH29DRAFT_998109 [Suillus ampliporus]|nr:hypothetical protein DFH29DRAFT_998109 [Suillus ampliporus]
MGTHYSLGNDRNVEAALQNYDRRRTRQANCPREVVSIIHWRFSLQVMGNLPSLHFLERRRTHPLFDGAFLSRFSIAIKYPELDASARLTIWRKLFELAGCPLWGSESEGFVDVDGKEPCCYVSLSDLEALAQKPFNGQHALVILPTGYQTLFPGRTIENLVRTAQALALSAKEPLSLDHVKVVRAQEKFSTEFMQIRS